MSHFMVPKKAMFVKELPKTSTGKIQKFELRVIAKTFTTLKSKYDSNERIMALPCF